MSTQMTKVWFDGKKIVSQEIPEEKIYWKSITQEDIDKAWEWAQKSSPYGMTRIEVFARSIEAKIKEKNT